MGLQLICGYRVLRVFKFHRQLGYPSDTSPAQQTQSQVRSARPRSKLHLSMRFRKITDQEYAPGWLKCNAKSTDRASPISTLRFRNAGFSCIDAECSGRQEYAGWGQWATQMFYSRMSLMHPRFRLGKISRKRGRCASILHLLQ